VPTSVPISNGICSEVFRGDSPTGLIPCGFKRSGANDPIGGSSRRDTDVHNLDTDASHDVPNNILWGSICTSADSSCRISLKSQTPMKVPSSRSRIAQCMEVQGSHLSHCGRFGGIRVERPIPICHHLVASEAPRGRRISRSVWSSFIRAVRWLWQLGDNHRTHSLYSPRGQDCPYSRWPGLALVPARARNGDYTLE
jgi:hypothetical protein